MLNSIGLVFTVSAVLAEAAGLSGHVLDPAGKPAGGARVFMEPGLAGALIETRATEDGVFRFEHAPLGGVGVFAIAEGCAFGGQHLDVAVGDPPPDITIRLAPADSVGGRICDPRGNPVPGARITRVGLLGATKVGIPLSKLAAVGFEEPVSSEDGRFTVSRLPQGDRVSLKISHPLYAQEALDEVPVGSQELRVDLSPGVLVRGVVRSRDQGLPVLSAEILVRSGSPPYDTAVTTTDASGEFALRLKPGLYLYQTASAAYRSLGWQKLAVTGGGVEQQVSLVVVGVGRVGGKVCDAQSGAPIPGARVLVEAEGNAVGIVRTGQAGEFELATSEGENVVRLEGVPGYRPAELPGQRVQVVQGKRTDVPTFWLAPIPAYAVQVVDGAMQPVPGAVVQVLRPAQFGWHVADTNGYVAVRVGALPPDGMIVGLAEHPAEPLGALFALRPQDSSGAKVQLLPFGTVTGTVVTAKGRAVSGTVVGAVFAENLIEDPLWLWRTVANKEGEFAWPAVVPHVAQRCVATDGHGASGESAPFDLEPAVSKDLGNVVVQEGADGDSAWGRPLKWYDCPLVSGVLPDGQERKNKLAWVVYCGPEEAAMVIEGLAVARDILKVENLLFAVVVRGRYAGGPAPMAVLSGKAPSAATTYLVDGHGKVVLETFGMPPVHIVRALCGSGSAGSAG